MPYANCKFIKRIAEFRPEEEREQIPNNTRGIYVLLLKAKDNFDVVYIGKTGGNVIGMYGRLQHHSKSKHGKWTHFTLFEVHDNITSDEIRELEGLIRHIYRKDSGANKLNVQLCYKPFQSPKVLKNSLVKWD